MSATIFWESINPNPKHLRVLAPSSFISTLDRAGMALPNTFGKSDIPTLRGMAATIDGKYNPFNELIAAIEKNGDVNVWYEH
jgi:hypothetical protein